MKTLTKLINFQIKKIVLSALFCSILSLSTGYTQCVQDSDGRFVTAAGEPCVNTLITAVSVLRVAPDARSASMGDAGIATSADASSIHFNTSKLAFAEQKMSFGLSYTHWLRSIDVGNTFVAYLSGFHQLDPKNTLAIGLTYFSLGDIQYTNANGMPLGTGNPYEVSFNVGYARKFNQRFSGGLNLKYIRSDLAPGQPTGNTEISASESAAVDLSFTYKNPSLTVGLAISNIGPGISYTNSENKDKLPTNLGIGVAWTKELGDKSSLTFTTDINKLLVPTPDFTLTDNNNNGIPDYKEYSLFEGMFKSFGDAPNGFEEELNEIMYSFGGELWLEQIIALRAGYFTEHQTKGNRKYLTVGLGIKYKSLTLNGSYLIPNNNERSPLKKTFRVSLLADIGERPTK